MPWFRKKIIYCSRPLLLVWNEVALRSKRSRFKAFPASGHGMVKPRVDHAKSERWYSGSKEAKKLGMMMTMMMMYCPVKGWVFWNPKNLQDELMDSWLDVSRFPIPGTLDSLKLTFAFWKYLESQKEMKKHTEFPIPGCLRLSETNMTPEQSARTQKEASFSKHWFSEVKVAGARCSAFGKKLLLYLFSRCIVGPCALLSWILSWMVCWMVGLWSKSCRRPDGLS